MEITLNDENQVVVFKSDRFLYDKKITEDVMIMLLSEGPCQPTDQDILALDKENNGDTKRKNCFCSFYYYSKNPLNENIKSSWLSYSLKQNVAYCHICSIFSPFDKISWVTGYNDFNKIRKSAALHSSSKIHKTSLMSAISFKEKFNLKILLNKDILNEQRKCTEVLNILFDAVRTLAG